MKKTIICKSLKKILLLSFVFSIISFIIHPLKAYSRMDMNRYSVYVDSKLSKKYKKSVSNDVVVLLKNSESAVYSGERERLALLKERIAVIEGKMLQLQKKLALKNDKNNSHKTENKALERFLKLEKKKKKLLIHHNRIEKNINHFVDKNSLEKVGRLISSLKSDKGNDNEIVPNRIFKKIPALSGRLSRRGFRKLKKSPDVLSIYRNYKVFASLDVSAPLINSDITNSTIVSSENIDGSGETIAVIDSGIDYTHQALGNCQPQSFITISSQGLYSLESKHDYLNNFDYTWTITGTGNVNTAVYFEKINLEKGYDFLYVMDGNGNVVQKFTGNYNNQFWSRSVPGEVIKVRLVTDYDIRAWGFSITKIADAVTNETPLANCAKVVGGYDFVSDDFNPYDNNGHGTHVSGIVSSTDLNYKGIAPGSKIVALKVLDNAGSGDTADVAAAIEWSIDNKDIYGISVINLSLGDNGQYASSAFCDQFLSSQMVNLAVSNGIFVVAASGNSGYISGISLPACASGATSVGGVYSKDWGSLSWSSGCTDSTTGADKIVCHTNRSNLLDLLAPGAVISSAAPGGNFVQKSGTSMATPHVAGAAALVQQNERIINGTPLPPSQLTSRLKTTGVSILDSGGTGLTFKRVDTYASLGWTTTCTSFNELTFPAEYTLQGTSSWDSILKILGGNVTVTNVSANDIYEARMIIYDISQPSVSLYSPDGYMDVSIKGVNYTNAPYIYYGRLAPGESFFKEWNFFDPQIKSFSFKAALFSKDCP